ncbi:MAG: hypothetical protein LBF93_09615, partial [Zoogloeaceae bacterium]|nr:hypothetical protein [Zoogloeaceae bacterium]
PELTQNGKTATQNRWIAYNRMRGQHMSAMEHAVPEQFWVDKSQCRYVDENGQIQNPAYPDCGIDAILGQFGQAYMEDHLAALIVGKGQAAGHQCG